MKSGYALPCTFALMLVGCGDTEQDRVSIPLLVAGEQVTEPVLTANGWSVALQRADLAFGPLYLCAAYQAGALCDTARAEWIGSVVVNALDGESREAGALSGVTGSVRSWMYDLGITSLLTQQTPQVLAAADALGGNSVRLAGTATKDAAIVEFTLELPVRQDESTERGVSVVRKSSNEEFAHDITGAERALTVRFDARPWVRDIDFELVVTSASCDPADGRVVCTGFSPETQAYRAVRGALVAGSRPSFQFSDAH